MKKMDLTALKAALQPKEGELLEQILSNPTGSIKDYEVELDEQELVQAILDAKIKKTTRLQYEKNDEIRRKNANELMKPFNPDELIWFCEKFYMDRFNKQFIFDDNNKTLVKKLSEYFTNSKEFELGDYSLNKGIMIMGNVGTGKTEIMKFFQKNKKRCYIIKSCKEIADDYLVYKDNLEAVYTTPVEKPLHDPAVFFQRYIGFCYDDLGTEELKNAFGNKKNVMADIIMHIYDNPEYTEDGKKDYSKYHITTNLSSEKELEDRYGTRVVSRLMEMFNDFTLIGKDRRK